MAGRKGCLGAVFGAAIALLFAGGANASWQPAVPVSGPTASPWDDWAVAANARGDAYVVWRNWVDPYNSTLHGARRSAGVWSAPAEVSDPAGFDPDPRPFITTGHPDDPAVAVAPSGEALVAWSGPAVSSSDRNGADFVRVMIVPPGQATGPRMTLARGQTTRVEVAVGYDDRGNATLFYWDGDSVHVMTRPAGGSFGSATQLSRGDNASYPSFAFAGNGAAAGIFVDADGVVAVARDAGGAFERRQLAPALYPVQGLSVAMNDTGAALFAWSECADPDACGRGRLKAVHRPADGPPGSPQTLAEHWASPVLAVSPDGEATAVSHGLSGDAPLLAWTRHPGELFGRAETVTTVAPGGLIQAAYDPRGNLHVAWNTYYGNNNPDDARPYVTMRPAGGTWQPAHVPPGVPNLAAAVLAPAGDASMLAAWMSGADVRVADFTATDAPPGAIREAAVPPPEDAASSPQNQVSQSSTQQEPNGRSAPTPPVARARLSSFLRRLTSSIRRNGVDAGVVPVWFAPPTRGRLAVTISHGRTIVASGDRRVTRPTLVDLRPRRSAVDRLAAAVQDGRRPAVRIRVAFRPDEGAALAVSRTLRLTH